MRLRRQRDLIELVKVHPWRADLPGQGAWQSVWPEEQKKPLHLEVGSGRGGFLLGMALKNPEIRFLGLEKVPEVAFRACEKLANQKISNARLVVEDAQDLRLLFGPGEVDRIYLNFSDPWPKNRYGKRRLTHRNFLVQYHGVLADGGSIHFKTDNRGLFEFSLNEFAELGLNMKNISLDLHANEPEDNVRTEYETKFSGLGFPIFRVEVCFPENWQWTSLKEEKQV